LYVFRAPLHVCRAHPYDTFYDEKNIILDGEFLKELKQLSPLVLNVRSSLTCKSNGSICQKMLWVDLAQEKLIL
jgi:hypothetical protein